MTWMIESSEIVIGGEIHHASQDNFRTIGTIVSKLLKFDLS